jgi:hypothetical protein
MGFTQMLSGDGNVDEVSRLATDHGGLDARGQLTAAGDQLARALLNKAERERYFVFGESCPFLSTLGSGHHIEIRAGERPSIAPRGDDQNVYMTCISWNSI